MNITEDRKELFKAIAAAQGEFTTVEKSAKNPHFNSKFAPLDNIIEMLRPILPKHGLSVIQSTDIPEDGVGVIVETIIAHDSGQYISGRLFMPTVKNDPQGYGSAITYGRRYALAAALGIVSDEDVDGNQTDAKPPKREPAKAPAPLQSGETPALTGKDTEYVERIRDALKTLYGNDRVAALDEVERLTVWRDKETGEVKRDGIRDYTKLKGKSAEILCHTLEKMVQKMPQREPGQEG